MAYTVKATVIRRQLIDLITSWRNGNLAGFGLEASIAAMAGCIAAQIADITKETYEAGRADQLQEILSLAEELECDD